MSDEYVSLRKEEHAASVVTVGMGTVHLDLAMLFEGAAWSSLHVAMGARHRGRVGFAIFQLVSARVPCW